MPVNSILQSVLHHLCHSTWPKWTQKSLEVNRVDNVPVNTGAMWFTWCGVQSLCEDRGLMEMTRWNHQCPYEHWGHASYLMWRPVPLWMGLRTRWDHQCPCEHRNHVSHPMWWPVPLWRQGFMAMTWWNHQCPCEHRTHMRHLMWWPVSWCFEPSQPQMITSGLENKH